MLQPQTVAAIAAFGIGPAISRRAVRAALCWSSTAFALPEERYLKTSTVTRQCSYGAAAAAEAAATAVRAAAAAAAEKAPDQWGVCNGTLC